MRPFYFLLLYIIFIQVSYYLRPETAPDIVFSVGEVVNGNPYELALSLIEDGFRVREIFAGPSPEYAFYIRRLAELSPETMVYSNMEPTMIYYCPDRENRRQTHVTLGKDAAFYHQDAVHVLWCSDEQPWGFAASRKLAQAIRGALAESMAEKNRAAAKNSMAEKNRAATKDSLVQSNEPEGPDSRREDTDCAAAIPAVESHETDWQAGSIRGLRKFLTPFAPDQSGAESVLYELGGIIVILDAGGCAGNICGFDEPRWSKTRSAVFSAGLRDMDAVMGRDRLLVKKVCDCGCDTHCQIPEDICGYFDEELVLSGEQHRLFVTLGQFSIIRLERDVQIVVPVVSYSVPSKQCCDTPGCAEDPCEMFSRIPFPEEQFSPKDCDEQGCCYRTT